MTVTIFVIVIAIVGITLIGAAIDVAKHDHKKEEEQKRLRDALNNKIFLILKHKGTWSGEYGEYTRVYDDGSIRVIDTSVFWKGHLVASEGNIYVFGEWISYLEKIYEKALAEERKIHQESITKASQ